jgi:cytochrome c oxidase subunit II
MLVTVALLGGGCSVRLIPGGATSQGQEIHHLWQIFLVTALCVGSLVWGLIIWSVLRYRKRDDSPPAQFRQSTPIELFYTGLPVLIVAVLFTISFRTQQDVDRLDPHPAVTIEVTGFQWQWRFRYLNEGVSVIGATGKPPVMVVPTHTTVRLVLTSPDVAHSFYVPAFLFKRDLIPGVHNEIDLNVDHEGTYDGHCAEFCGLDHDRMTFTVRAVARPDYQAWVNQQRGGSS